MNRYRKLDSGWPLFLANVAASSLHTLVLSPDGEPIDYLFDAVNPAFTAMTGLEANDVVGKTSRQIFPVVDPGFLDRMVKVARTGVSTTFDFWSVPLGRWLRMASCKIGPNRFGLTYVEMPAKDGVIRRSEQEDAAIYRTFFDMPNAVKLVVDANSLFILEANSKAAEFYGWSREELRQMRIHDLTDISSEEAALRTREIQEGLVHHFYLKHKLRSGEVRDVEVYSSPGPWYQGRANFAIVHDVTEVRRLERQALQAERLRAVGELTTSLYHEFGNLLGVLTSQFQLLELELPDGPTKALWHGRVQEALTRALKLAESVKRFSRTRVPTNASVRLSPLVEDLIELERPLCRERQIRVDFQPSIDDWVSLDASLVQNISLNLFKNSVEALEATDNPRITIEVSHEEGEVVFRFGDNGPPIPNTVRQKLFTPFFTTKAQGTGLGLSFCWTVVSNHAGKIFLEDGPSKFFQIRLPLAKPNAGVT